MKELAEAAKRTGWRRAVVAALGLSWGFAALAQVAPRHVDPLHSQVLAPAGFVATVAPQELAAVQAEVSPELLAAIAAFEEAHGSSWGFWVDRRSGALALAEGKGIPWIPGAGNGLDPAEVNGSGTSGTFTAADLESMAREFIAAYPAMFGAPASQLVLETAGTKRFGESGQFWQVAFRQQVAGVPVDHSRIVLRLSHGNLVQFGVDRVAAAGVIDASTPPALDAAAAEAALGLYVGGWLPGDVLHVDGALSWVLRGTADEVGYSGPVGAGWTPHLVYEYVLERPGQVGTWSALVDAHSGAVIRFVDANDYASLAKASVYTETNCADPLDCVPGSTPEVTVTMPFARIEFTGGTCSGDDCYTNAAGAFEYPPGAVSATTTLEGKYFQIVDSCGAISASASAPGDIDLGTTPPDNTGLNTDCVPATRESAPGTGPVFGGPGDTHASRSIFYHLNLINQKARGYLPDNDWLKGNDGSAGPVPTNVNGPPACNAFWSGAGALVFFRRTNAGVLNCNNFGEIPDIFLHEFGHGLDSNDASGSAGEGGTGEAMGDTFAVLQGQDSCLGPGAFIGSLAGYNSVSSLCSGVRDIDYTRFCYPGGVDGCTAAPLDPDVTHGSRSGTNPDLGAADAGTPARWNHMIESAPVGVADGMSNFYDCGGPETTGCAGPLNHGCHCESAISAQANWSFATRLIRDEFGGDIYADPPGPTEVSGWQYLDRLWYLTRDLAGSAYSVTGPAPLGMTNGCAATNWYATYRFIDDDDGDLSNGTPHSGYLFDAFDLHAIACGNSGDPANQQDACPTPPAAPVLDTCGQLAPVQLDWTDSPGATSYRVLRNTLGCDSGFTPVATVDGDQLFFEDAEVAAGIPYYYSVQSVGESSSCYGQTSNCIVVAPTDCSASALAAPTGLAVSTPADNTALVEWNAVTGAAAYKIERRTGSCASGGAFSAIATVQSPGTAFTDTAGVQGGLTYAYRVSASDSSCAACTGDLSVCVDVEATGDCQLSPSFDGVELVGEDPENQCQLLVQWSPAQPACGSTITYDVYRSTDAAFAPTLANRIATSVTGTSYTDLSVAGDVRYYYVVRATDGVGNRENNTARKSGIAGGDLAPGPYEDDAGDTGADKFAAGTTPGNTWTVVPAGTGNATRQYASTAGGAYPNDSCMALESNEIQLGLNPTLDFRSRFVIEPGWDGGIVEVATEGGGFSDWTKLNTIVYPGVIAGGLTELCDGNPGLADGQPAFTGDSLTWLDFGGSLVDYANQVIKVRFLLGSDEATNDQGWFVDDISIDDALVPGSCLSEVSSRESANPLRVGKAADGKLDVIFEDLGATATSYNVYEGEIGNWTGHGQATLCHVTTTQANDPGPGDRKLADYTPLGVSSYILVNASDGSDEGVLGFDSAGTERPTPPGACGPTP